MIVGAARLTSVVESVVPRVAHQPDHAGSQLGPAGVATLDALYGKYVGRARLEHLDRMRR